MDFNCPACGVDLSRIHPERSGKEKAAGRYFQCAQCGSALIKNWHPNEWIVLPALMMLVAFFNAVAFFFNIDVPGWKYIFMFTILGAGLALLQWTAIPKRWPRYLLHSAEADGGNEGGDET